MHEEKNRTTQPLRQGRVFASWDVVPRGWYVAIASSSLAKGQVTSVTLCGQRVALFRGEDGKVRALDAFCAHMGTDLGIGKVHGNTVACFFHHWRYDESGACIDIPCQKGDRKIPPHARVRPYATEERYGYVWVYPEAEAPYGVFEFPELEGQEVVFSHEPARESSCHHHVAMINGIDAQHLATVHGLDFAATVSVAERPERHEMDFVVTCTISDKTLVGRVFRFFLGDSYAYGMRYANACAGALTTMKGVRLFGGKRLLPTLHMIWAYTPIARDLVRTYPIFVAKKRAGVVGAFVSRFLMWMQKRGYYALRSEDSKIYDNIRFSPNALLPIDEPLGKYLAYTNALEASAWSTTEAVRVRLPTVRVVADGDGPPEANRGP
jgi:phenylpropionate dioxygenase-like ring-hydroxylating dioxygenase large terminal subunit